MPKIAYQRRQEKGERRPVRLKIKKVDLVRVIAGRVKGKSGKGETGFPSRRPSK